LTLFSDQIEKATSLETLQPSSEVIQLLISLCKELKDESKFPAIDLLRILCFSVKNVELIISSNVIIELLNNYFSSGANLGKGFKLMLFRLCSNFFATAVGIEYMTNSANIEIISDSIVKSLNETESFTLMGAASFAYNFSFHLSSKNSDQSIQCVSCFVEKLNEISDIESNVALLLIVGLGNLLFKNETNIELVSALQVNLAKFSQSKTEKTKQAALEVMKIMTTK